MRSITLKTTYSFNEASKSCEVRRTDTRYNWTQLLSQVSKY